MRIRIQRAKPMRTHPDPNPTLLSQKVWHVYPGSRIPDPGSDFFPSRIPYPNCLHPGSRILIKEFKYFNPKKSKKMVSKLLKVWSGLFIPDPGSGCWLFPIPDPGSRGQKGTQSRIPDPDPPHCIKVISHKIYLCRYVHKPFEKAGNQVYLLILVNFLAPGSGSALPLRFRTRKSVRFRESPNQDYLKNSFAGKRTGRRRGKIWTTWHDAVSSFQMPGTRE